MGEPGWREVDRSDRGKPGRKSEEVVAVVRLLSRNGSGIFVYAGEKSIEGEKERGQRRMERMEMLG